MNRWGERVLWSIVGVIILLWALRLFGYVDIYPLISVAVVVLGLWGLGVLAASWAPWRSLGRRSLGLRHPRVVALLPWMTLAVALGALAIWAFMQIYMAPGYGTDEIAFDQFAAQLAQHGINPYVHSMAPALELFHVAPDGFTLKLNGSPVTALSYPAMAFELYLPFLIAGWSSQLAVVLNVVAWIVSIVMLFVMLPRRLRPAAIIVGSLSVYIAYAVGGVTDSMFVPFLILAAYRWNRFGTEYGWKTWIGPIALGLAMGIKQTPWVLVPFLVVGIFAEVKVRRGTRDAVRQASRYFGIAMTAFIVPNLPYIAMNLHAWVNGILSPLDSHTVPAGQGLIGLSLFLGLGGGSLTAYTIASVVLLLAIWATYSASYPLMRGWTFILPSVVLFFATRSYGSYLVTLVPAALVAVTSIAERPVPFPEPLLQGDPVQGSPSQGDPTQGDSSASVDDDLRSHDSDRAGHADRAGHSERVGALWANWAWVAGIGSAASAVAIAGALLISAPLSLSIVSITTTGQLATVEQISVRATNNTANYQRPAFTVESNGTLSAFWLVGSGPRVLPPHSSAVYNLLSPDFSSQPPITGGFQMVAFTDNPGTVSASAAYLPNTWHVFLEPDALRYIVPVGKTIVVKAHVLNRFNQPVKVAQIPVYLGQIIYAQRGIIYSEAVVNNSQIGQTPVSALTNSNGVATFRIRGTQVTANPVYFEGNLVNFKDFYPYGYSEILPIRFKPAIPRPLTHK